MTARTEIGSAVRNPLGGGAPSRRELLLATGALAVLALGIYLPHIVNGGWYVDDWIDVARLSEAGDLLDKYRAMKIDSYRPGLAMTFAVVYEIAGQTQSVYLLIGALLAAIGGVLFYLVLRALRLRGAIAGTAAAIYVVLPCIDATRLWFAAFPIQVAAVLYLAGALVALHGLAATGRRAIAWHAGAAVLFFAAVLTYELVAGLIVVTALLYLLRAGWRPAARRLPADLAAIALALAIIAPRASEDREATLSLGFLWDRAGQTLDGAEAVFRWLFPAHEVLGGTVGGVLLAIGMLGAGIAIGRGDELGRTFAAWAWIAAFAAIFALAGLVMLLPADAYFVPRTGGVGDRTGALAAFGAVLLLMALIVLAAGGLGVLAQRARWGLYVAVGLIALTGVNLGLRELRHQDAWADSWRRQQDVLAAIDTAMGSRIPADAAIVSFNHTTYILPIEVLVFANSWDLRGAVWETFDRPQVAAHPWEAGAVCAPDGVAFPDGSSEADGAEPYGYGKLFFIDVPTRAATRIANRAECEAAVSTLTGEVS